MNGPESLNLTFAEEVAALDDFFDGLLQAYVFVFLTGLYIKEAVEE